VAVTQSKIRAVRRVVRQLPLQQCSSASSCMQTSIVMEEHYTGVSNPHLLFWMALCSFFSLSQYTCDVIVVPYCMNSTISIPFMSQKTVPICRLSGRRLSKLFQLVWWKCVHPLLWLLIGFNFHKWNPGFITCYSYNVIKKFIAIFWGIALKRLKAKAILYVLCAPMSIFRTHLAQNLW
jgi:hypothetical protein